MNPLDASAELNVYNAFFKHMQGSRWINRYHRAFNASKCGDIWGHLMHETFVVASTDSLDMRSMDWICARADLIRVVIAPIAGSPFGAPSAHFNVACKLLSYLALNQGPLGAYSRKRLLDMQVIQLLSGYLGDAARFEEGVAPLGGPAMSPSYNLVVLRRKAESIYSSPSKRSSILIRRPSSAPRTVKNLATSPPRPNSPLAVSPPQSSYTASNIISVTPLGREMIPSDSKTQIDASAMERISQVSSSGKRGKLLKESSEGPAKLKLDVLACLSPPRSNTHAKRWTHAIVTAPMRRARSPPRSKSLPMDTLPVNASSLSSPLSIAPVPMRASLSASLVGNLPHSPPAPPPPTPSAEVSSDPNVSVSSNTANLDVDKVIEALQGVLSEISIASGSLIPDFTASSDIHTRINELSGISASGSPTTLRAMCARLGLPYRKHIFGPCPSKYDAEEMELAEAQDSMSASHVDDFWATLAYLHAILSTLGHSSNLVDRIVLKDLNWSYNIDEGVPRPPNATKESMERAVEDRKKDRMQRLQGAWYLLYVPTHSVISTEFMNEVLMLMKVNTEKYTVEGVGAQWRSGNLPISGTLSRETGLLESLEMNFGSSSLKFTPAQLRAFNFGGIIGGSYHTSKLYSSEGSKERTFGGSWLMWKAIAESTSPTIFTQMRRELLDKGERVSCQMTPFMEDMTRLGVNHLQSHYDQLLLLSRSLQKIVYPQLLMKSQVSSLRDQVLDMSSKYPVSQLRRPSWELMRQGGDTPEKLEMRVGAQRLIEPSLHAIRMQLAWFYGPYIDVDIEQLRRWNIKRALDRYYAWKTVFETSLLGPYLSNILAETSASTLEPAKTAGQSAPPPSELMATYSNCNSEEPIDFPTHIPSTSDEASTTSKEAHAELELRTATVIASTGESSEPPSLASKPRSHRHRVQKMDVSFARVNPEEILQKMDQGIIDSGARTDRMIYEDLWRCGVDPFLDNSYWKAKYPMMDFDERAVPKNIEMFARILRPEISDDRTAHFWASVLHYTARTEKSIGGEEVEYEPMLQARDVDLIIAEWNRRLQLCHVSSTTDPRLTHDTILAYLVSLRADCYIDSEQLGEKYFGAEWDHDKVEPKRDSSLATQAKFISRKVKAQGTQLSYPDLRPRFTATANAILHQSAPQTASADLEGEFRAQECPSQPQEAPVRDSPVPRPQTPTLPLISKPSSISYHLPLTKITDASPTSTSDPTEEGDRDDANDIDDSPLSTTQPKPATKEPSLTKLEEAAIREARRRSVGGEPQKH